MKFLETSSPSSHRPSSVRFSQALAPTEVVFFKDDGVLVLGFAKQLPLGEGVLKMDFTGILNDQMRCFYRRYATTSFWTLPPLVFAPYIMISEPQHNICDHLYIRNHAMICSKF